MSWLHSNSLRYALALWLATVLALYITFLLQLEPAQWSAITVWIMFIQTPRLNYSKILWWAFGTIVGASMAVLFLTFFNQAPVLFFLSLSSWLAICAAAAKLVNYYRSYGWVLAGYTCAIVSMSSVDHPDQAFMIAVTRVSCICIGMTCAVIMMTLLLPKHRHWPETRHQLAVHLKASLLQAAQALAPNVKGQASFTWRHMVDRLSTLEHTLDITTAESADARIHTPQARSLVATLFDLLARAQSAEIYLSRPETANISGEVTSLIDRARTLLMAFAITVADEPMENSHQAVLLEIEQLKNDVALVRQNLATHADPERIADWFILDRLSEIVDGFRHSIQDWSGLYGPWEARRPSHLAAHRDYITAFIFGFRMFVTINLAGIVWYLTQWPSGSQFILFIAVTCSLLSLVDHAPVMGMAFLKSATFCFIMAYVEAFWLFQKGEGFPVLAVALGLFLLPAAYAYRHPRLVGSAVVSMLIFYGLSMPANQMNYDISAFLNNGFALLCAAAGGFFGFHAIPALTSKARQYWLLRAARKDLAHHRPSHGTLSDQGWTSCNFDRLRLLHRTGRDRLHPADLLDAENELLVCMQMGLRQRRLEVLLRDGELKLNDARKITTVLKAFRHITRNPPKVAKFLRSGAGHFETVIKSKRHGAADVVTALTEIRETLLLLENPLRLYRE